MMVEAITAAARRPRPLLESWSCGGVWRREAKYVQGACSLVRVRLRRPAPGLDMLVNWSCAPRMLRAPAGVLC